jgi:DNA-binding Lrp family transcriptional regulator
MATSECALTLDEVSKSLNIPSEECGRIIEFLAKYGFIRLEDSKVNVKAKMKVFITTTASDRTFPEELLSATQEN